MDTAGFDDTHVALSDTDTDDNSNSNSNSNNPFHFEQF
jgi:hypothetical protein